MCVHVCMCVHMYMCAHMSGDGRTVLGVIFRNDVCLLCAHHLD